MIGQQPFVGTYGNARNAPIRVVPQRGPSSKPAVLFRPDHRAVRACERYCPGTRKSRFGHPPAAIGSREIKASASFDQHIEQCNTVRIVPCRKLVFVQLDFRLYLGNFFHFLQKSSALAVMLPFQCVSTIVRIEPSSIHFFTIEKISRVIKLGLELLLAQALGLGV